MAGPTWNERQFLRGIAAANPGHPDESWWSARDLIGTPLFSDFRMRDPRSLSSTGRQCEARGWAVTRQVGTRARGWREYRITSAGRDLVGDSCIGGGLPWSDSGTCPACKLTLGEMHVLSNPQLVSEVPAHPLPALVRTGVTA